MIRREYDLPVWALAACLRWDNLGEGHPVFAETPLWRNEQAERELDEATRDELARCGLLEATGRVDPDFRDTLIVLTRPGTEFSCWAKHTEGSYRMLVAAIGRDTVLLTRVDEQVRFRPARPETPAEELVAQLPELGPAKAHAVNVPRSAYDELLNPTNTGIVHRRGGDPDAKRLYNILDQPRLHTAELHAATRDRSGMRKRARQATVLDTEQGRWLISLKPGGQPGDDWIVTAPATPQLLASTLYEMRDNPR
ncbi:MAG: hypothetical protein GEU98_21240 [Pseudonocardiaceae bacterium]|nr:hypothetical protein [Pseudonocardiaceae bacterium]